jgi:hypothetical protein
VYRPCIASLRQIYRNRRQTLWDQSLKTISNHTGNPVEGERDSGLKLNTIPL